MCACGTCSGYRRSLGSPSTPCGCAQCTRQGSSPAASIPCVCKDGVIIYLPTACGASLGKIKKIKWCNDESDDATFVEPCVGSEALASPSAVGYVKEALFAKQDIPPMLEGVPETLPAAAYSFIREEAARTIKRYRLLKNVKALTSEARATLRPDSVPSVRRAMITTALDEGMVRIAIEGDHLHSEGGLTRVIVSSRAMATNVKATVDAELDAAGHVSCSIRPIARHMQIQVRHPIP